MSSDSLTPLPQPEEPNPELAAFYNELDTQEEELGMKGLDEQSRRRNEFHTHRSERRLKNQLHQIALGGGLMGILFLIAYFTFDQNAVLGGIAVACLIFGGIAFFAANPEALDELDE